MNLFALPVKYWVIHNSTQFLMRYSLQSQVVYRNTWLVVVVVDDDDYDWIKYQTRIVIRGSPLVRYVN